MRTLKVLLILSLLLSAIVLLLLSPEAFAASVAGGAVTVEPLHLDFSPLIPVINGLIVAIAGVLSASVPVVVTYGVMWLRNHGLAVTQTAQKVISDRITATIQNGLKYATAATDEQVDHLTITVANPTVAKAANYAIAQSPVLLKQAGIDVTTEEGQATLVRRITAESMPMPTPTLTPTVVTVADAQKVIADHAPVTIPPEK